MIVKSADARAGTPRSSRPPSGPPEELSEWGEPVGEAVGAGTTEEIKLDVRQPSRYFLLWINKASEARDQAGRYQVEISDISLLD